MMASLLPFAENCMSTYLLEIGTEELPAGYINEAQERLQELTSEALKTANLVFETVSCLLSSQPRRKE
jgi:glycyl-tRNA synthetase beta subunit